MKSTREVALLTWLRDVGIDIPATPVWYWETGTNDARIAHSIATCAQIRGGLQELQMSADAVSVDHYLCDDCLLGHLDPLADMDQLKIMARAAYSYHRIGHWADTADSTFHVISGRTYPALHGAIVNDIHPQLRVELDRIELLTVLDPLRDVLTARLDALVAAHPYNPTAALKEAVCSAVRWKFRDETSKDIYTRQLKDHHNMVQSLRDQMITRVNGPGEIRRIAADIRRENEEFERELPEFAMILEYWIELFELAYQMTNPRFFSCNSITLYHHSVPRGPRDWIVGYGLRASTHVWGLGELPAILVEYLAANQRPNDKQVAVHEINIEHTTLETDQWEVAIGLWKEHMRFSRSEFPLADPAQAILAAVTL